VTASDVAAVPMNVVCHLVPFSLDLSSENDLSKDHCQAGRLFFAPPENPTHLLGSGGDFLNLIDDCPGQVWVSFCSHRRFPLLSMMLRDVTSFIACTWRLIPMLKELVF